jgi:hypothetical protein
MGQQIHPAFKQQQELICRPSTAGTAAADLAVKEQQHI